MRRPLCWVLVASVLIGCHPQPKAKAPPSRPWWEVAAVHHPPVTDIPLPLFGRHPRLVFRPAGDVGLGRMFDRPRELYANDATFRSIFDRALAVPTSQQDPAMLATSWIVTRDDTFARIAVDRMVDGTLSRSGEPYYSNVFRYALAYDWLFNHPAMTPGKRSAIEAKIVERLRTELADLDDDNMAAWHGRNQAANGVMIAALAVGDLPGCEPLLRRAAAHYIEALRCLQFSGGWPEGASYWIYNRAGPYPLAADCVMTALGSDHIAGLPIRQIMRTIGLWQIYQFAPNEVFEPYGDSAGSVRLGETGWWELTTDHYAKLSRDPWVAAGADYIRNHSPAPYGRRPYYWHVAFTYEPTVRPRPTVGADLYDRACPEMWMRRHLPQAMLFGRNSYGVAFFRGRWGDPDELYATFKAGDLLAHHDHYDTGSFTIQRGGELAPRTGRYGDYTGPHRLGYYVQSVSSNTLGVLAPGEFSSYLKRTYPQSWTSLSGGQRVIRPTSFGCVSVEHFRRQLNAGPHLERGDIAAFDSVPGRYDYVAADITAAYNSTRFAEPGNAAKVSRVTRQFVYLRSEQAFVVYDRVNTTDVKFVPRFILHSQSKPQTDHERRLASPPPTSEPATQAGPDSGIYETADRTIVTEHRRGRLTQRVLLPESARVLKIGGPWFSYYVERDGDESNGFDGVNLSFSRPGRKGSDQWRIEVEPADGAPGGRATRFLSVLLPRLADDRAELPRTDRLAGHAGVDAVGVGRTVVVFAHDAALPLRFTVDAPGRRDWLIVDCEPGRVFVLTGPDGGETTAQANGEGVIYRPDLAVRSLSALAGRSH